MAVELDDLPSSQLAVPIYSGFLPASHARGPRFEPAAPQWDPKLSSEWTGRPAYRRVGAPVRTRCTAVGSEAFERLNRAARLQAGRVRTRTSDPIHIRHSPGRGG